MEKTELAIVGGGPAGVTAALEAARHGAAVTLISDGPIGGRAGWHSLLPSKILLHAADEHGSQERLGPQALQEVTAHIHQVAERFNGQEAQLLEEAGVTVIQGKARFTGTHELAITQGEESRSLAFDQVIIASGSVPIFPPGMKPDGKRIIAPRFTKHLTALPEHMILVGGGFTGSEFVYAFAALGVKVTWLVDEYGVLPAFDPELGQALTVHLTKRYGVEMIGGVPTRSLHADESGVTAELVDGRRFRAEQAFVAIGRRPDVASLNLEALGLAPAAEGPAKGGLAVDDHARTGVAHVFAAGDVTGQPLVANKALAQAWTAARTATGQPTPPLNPEAWIQAVYTRPQVAQVGLTPARAAAEGHPVKVQTISYGRALKAHALDDPQAVEGYLRLISDAETGTVKGGMAFGEQAAAVLAPVVLAIQSCTPAEMLASLFPAYPTLSELPFLAARWG